MVKVGIGKVKLGSGWSILAQKWPFEVGFRPGRLILEDKTGLHPTLWCLWHQSGVGRGLPTWEGSPLPRHGEDFDVHMVKQKTFSTPKMAQNALK